MPKSREQQQAEEHERFLARLQELISPEERAEILAAAAVSDNAMMASKAMDMLNEFLGAKKEEPPLVPIFALPPDFNPSFQLPEGAKRVDYQRVPTGDDSQVGVGSSSADPLGLGVGKR